MLNTEKTPVTTRHGRPQGAPGRLLSAISVALATVGCAPPGPASPAAMTEPFRQSIRVGPPVNATLSYLRSGDAKGPRLILVHGTPGSANGWTDYVLQPPKGVEVVALDRPGFGRSEPEGALTSLSAQAAAVVALFPSDGRPVVLLGHSLGGPIVAQVAAEHPEAVAAVVLLSASLDPALEEIHPMQHVGLWWPVRAMLPRAMRNANDELMDLKPELERLATLLPQIKSRVLIVHGDKDDLVPVANVPFMQARLSGACSLHTDILPGKNHFLPWNSVDSVREAIRLAMEDGCGPTPLSVTTR
jgi:pimeloyl-ACP methyl ester carboxylesterase